MLALTWSALPREVGVSGPITLASWQRIFTVGLLAGWHRRGHHVQALLTSAKTLWVAVAFTAVALPVSHLWRRALPGETAAAASERLVDKDGTGPLRLVVSGIFFFLCRLVTVLVRSLAWARLARPLRRLGQRSLDCYFILPTIVLVPPAVWAVLRGSGRTVLLAGIGLLACWAWTLVRGDKQARGRLRC